MEIKSSLFNTTDMHPVRDSLIAISEKDGKQDFRVKLLNYIDDVSQDEDDQFFWEMMEFIRFLDPNTDAVAFTTPHKLIYLNSPGKQIGEKIRIWEFVYDHECLHQLWDTFGVEEKIKREGVNFNYNILNIASDCVINDYLRYNRKKEGPDFGIYPEVLKEQYNIEYNRKEDTQYSLYLKMMNSPKVKELEELAKQQEKLHNGKITPKEVEQVDGGDGAQDAAKEARKQMKKAQDNAAKQEGKPGKGWSHGGAVQKGESNVDNETDADLEEIAKRAISTIKKWQQKITGDLGIFTEKCNKSLDLNPSGLVAKTRKATSMWNDKMTTYISAFVKQKVFAKHREYKRTYKRIKRGSGIVKFGEPLQKGKIIKDDKLTINVAFYVDISGSMYNCIDNVFEAAYAISKTLDKMFGRDSVVEDLSYKMFPFNDYIKEIPWGKKVPASGDNVEFSEIVKYMSKHTKEFMINVIITDAQFDIGKNKVKDFMKDIDGMLLFITNQGSRDMEELSKELEGQVFYIKADNNFTIDEKIL